jgi:type IV secretory pathway TraG/TraD family ATPase VirD4
VIVAGKVNAYLSGSIARLLLDVVGLHSTRVNTSAPPSLFAMTTFRNWGGVFGIKQADRRSHMYVVGKTGTGKSTLLETLILQDIEAGRGAALLDPHGDLVERVLAQVPSSRMPDVVYFNVPDTANPVAFNPLDWVPQEKRSLAASGMLQAFKKLWPDYWGPRLEHVLRNAILTLVEQPKATMADILRLVSDAAFRKEIAFRLTNQRLREFWLKEFDQYTRNYRADSIAPIQSKVGAFLADPRLNAILSQPKSAFDLRRVIDEGKILLVNLAKGKIGEDGSSLLGSLLVSRLELAALSRADAPEELRRDFFIYLDEFHTFTTLSLATMLAELRKYRVSLIMAHQYLAQLEPDVRHAVLGNAGTIISFRVGPEDAHTLAREFAPEFDPLDLTRLPNYHIYLKLMVDGAPTIPFSARTITAGSETTAE